MQKQRKSSQETNAVVQLLSRVLLFVTPWTVACQAPLSSTISCGLLKLMSIDLVMPSNHLILCCPLSSAINLSPSFCSRDIHNNLTHFFELFLVELFITEMPKISTCYLMHNQSEESSSQSSLQTLPSKTFP